MLNQKPFSSSSLLSLIQLPQDAIHRLLVRVGKLWSVLSSDPVHFFAIPSTHHKVELARCEPSTPSHPIYELFFNRDVTITTGYS